MNDKMYIGTVHLTNFRNYADITLDLGHKTTVIIGKNGTGKTNMINAIKQSLSFIFSKKKDAPQYDFVASSDQKVKSFLPTDPSYINGDYRYPIAIEVDMALYDEEPLKWELRKMSADKSIDESYVASCMKFWGRVLDTGRIPVFAFFSDSYPHILSTMGKNIQAKLGSGNPLPQNTAYYKWDDDRNCTELWKQYYVMNWKNLRFGNKDGQKEYCEAIEHAIVSFTDPISEVDQNNPEFSIEGLDVEARGKEDVLVVKYRDGRRIPFDMLPQGYKRILSMVLDISHRGYLLQKSCDPYAIVFIDEVELHLHPSLAQEIIQRFRRSFKNTQFIISTHSPLVIADYKQDPENILYSISSDNGKVVYTQVKDIYGMDYISVLHGVMDTPERDSYLQNLVGAYRYWRQLNDRKRMKQLEETIRRHVGDGREFLKRLVE